MILCVFIFSKIFLIFLAEKLISVDSSVDFFKIFYSLELYYSYVISTGSLPFHTGLKVFFFCELHIYALLL